MYADDCILVNTHDQNEQIESKICKDMELLIKYFHGQSLILNQSKTNFIVFNTPYSKASNPDEITIKLMNESNSDVVWSCIIKRVDKVKYLGLLLDSQLKWDEHIKLIESKIASAAGILWKLRHQLPTTTKKAIYTSLVDSHLNYLTPIWGSANESVLQSLQIAQNRALRNVYSLDRLENRVNMYQNLVENFLPIRAMFFVNSAAFVYNSLKKKHHTNMNFSYTIPRSCRTRRYLKPQKFRTQFGARCITSIGAKIFNELPDEIQNSIHIHRLKQTTKDFVRNESFLETSFNGQFLSKYL
jgi:hypothetical protein